MASLNATAVAKDVIKMVEKGVKVNHRSLLLKHGYSEKVARNPYKVTKTKSYMAIIKKVVPNMEIQRARMLEEINRKDLSKEKLSALLAGLDILTKNIQLLSGKSTSNVAMVIEVSESVANKYNTKKEDSQEQAN